LINKIRSIEYAKLEQQIQKQKWTFAKTYPKDPHEYITKESNPIFFDKMCKMIDEEGYDGKWKDGNTYKYLKIGSHKYWHFDMILNREKIARL